MGDVTVAKFLFYIQEECSHQTGLIKMEGVQGDYKHLGTLKVINEMSTGWSECIRS